MFGAKRKKQGKEQNREQGKLEGGVLKHVF